MDMANNFKNNAFRSKIYSTNKQLKKFLPTLLCDIEKKYLKNPNLIIDYWPKLVGKKLAPMTKAISFENKTLYVLVKSSTLFSILKTQEKRRLLKLMQDKFSRDTIYNIVFKIG